MICRPSGRPSLSTPAGTEMPGRPAIEAGMVNMSLRYMVTGSAIFSPAAEADVAAGGDERGPPLWLHIRRGGRDPEPTPRAAPAREPAAACRLRAAGDRAQYRADTCGC